ncbi:zinc-ribbon domain containing protein [Niallia sp. JL1B1071]
MSIFNWCIGDKKWYPSKGFKQQRTHCFQCRINSNQK